jgi:hypothetical protein
MQPTSGDTRRNMRRHNQITHICAQNSIIHIRRWAAAQKCTQNTARPSAQASTVQPRKAAALHTVPQNVACSTITYTPGRQDAGQKPSQVGGRWGKVGAATGTAISQHAMPPSQNRTNSMHAGLTQECTRSQIPHTKHSKTKAQSSQHVPSWNSYSTESTLASG